MNELKNLLGHIFLCDFNNIIVKIYLNNCETQQTCEIFWKKKSRWWRLYYIVYFLTELIGVAQTLFGTGAGYALSWTQEKCIHVTLDFKIVWKKMFIVNKKKKYS